MSDVIEKLIKKWTQANASVSNSITKLSEEVYEEVKGYIPESLKTQFKVFCMQRRVTMSSALYILIYEWVKAETDQ